MNFFPVALQAVVLCFSVGLSSCGGGSSGGNAASPPVAITTPPVTVPAVTAPAVTSPVTISPVAPSTPVVSPVVTAPVAPPEIRILVIGQSIASNCNEKIFGPSPNVFQIGLTGDVKEASDPFDWADCKKGSMWMPFGKRLIDAGLASKVTFMPIGVAGTSVAAWQSGGTAFAKLNSAIDVIKSHGITFDYALWHQGSSDFGTDGDAYVARLSSVIAYVNSNVKIGSWLVAIHSRCFGTWDRTIESAQLRISSTAGDNIFQGPNNNLLDESYRFDTCHLNEKGQEAMAGLWLDAIRNSNH